VPDGAQAGRGFFSIADRVLIGNTDCAGAVNIPEGVTGISNGAFDTGYGNGTYNSGFSYYNNGINTLPTIVTSLTIPNTVTSIGAYAFRSSNITTLVIPDSVTSMGEHTFIGATSLETLTLGNGLTHISDASFAGATELTSLTIPAAVTTIGGAAFAGATSLVSLTFLGAVTSIGAEAFMNASVLTSLTIPNSVTSIGNSAFENAFALTSLIIPAAVTSIGNRAFANTTGLTSITIPNSVTSIGIAAFVGAGNVTELTIGNSVTTIGANAFEGLYSLISLTIPNSVTSLDYRAFAGVSALTSLTIGNGISTIRSDQFDGVSNIQTLVIGDGVTSVEANAFDGQTSLTSLTIGNNVISIGASAFAGATSLASLTIPNEVTTIGASAFSGATSLTSLTIPNSVTTVGSNAFLNNAVTNLELCKTFDLTNAGISISTPSGCEGKTVPAAPTIGTATLTSPTTASISFTAPSVNGGKTITRYIATSSTGSFSGTIRQTGSGTIAVTGLTRGTTYTFTVVARNQLGNSLPSAASNAITTPTFPSAPTVGSVTLTGTTASIPFTASSSNGGSAITRYTATSDSGGFTGFISQAGSGTISVPGLTSGETYTFTVVARNEIGDSDPSTQSNSVTVPNVPDSPTSVSVTRVNATTADVTFIAPSSTGGSAITSYIATSSPGEITASTSQPTDRTIRVTGLSASTTYTFTVLARNQIGDSFPSDTSNTLLGAAYSTNTGSGTVACTTDGSEQGAGYFTIVNNVVTNNNNCRGRATIPDGVVEIAAGAFSESDNLTTVVIADSVETIGAYAFEYAGDLTTLTLGIGLGTLNAYLAPNAFEGTNSLTTINYCGERALVRADLGIDAEVTISCIVETNNPPPPPPPPVPYLRSLTAPVLRLQDGKLICSAGTYNAGFTISGVIQGNPTALFAPTSYTYNLLFKGVAQTSLAKSSSLTSQTWNMPTDVRGVLITCSVTASGNSATNFSTSSENTAGLGQAEEALSKAIADADANYSKALIANSKMYDKALVENRATWRQEIQTVQATYNAELARIKALQPSRTTRSLLSAALKIRIANQRKSAADYTASKPAALAARDAQNKAALDAKNAAVTKATTEYATSLNSQGYGVLIP
jgi:hypothetical protein